MTDDTEHVCAEQTDEFNHSANKNKRDNVLVTKDYLENRSNTDTISSTPVGLHKLGTGTGNVTL